MHPPRTITEIKYRPGKPPLEWTCEVVELDPPKRAHVRYVSDEEYCIEGTLLPVGTVTDALYWSDRSYHVWRFTAPDGTHLGYRFDVCTSTFIWPERIIWKDLELDLWVSPDGVPHWQDEDDMTQLVRMEHLSQEELGKAEAARKELEARFGDVIREAFGDDTP